MSAHQLDVKSSAVAGLAILAVGAPIGFGWLVISVLIGSLAGSNGLY